jgi:hypothetical protein
LPLERSVALRVVRSASELPVFETLAHGTVPLVIVPNRVMLSWTEDVIVPVSCDASSLPVLVVTVTQPVFVPVPVTFL